jgi:hypothetical protein
MSTTMRTFTLATRSRPLRPGQSAAPQSWRRGLVWLEKWAIAHPTVASVALAAAYLASLVALVAVLATATFSTALGFGVSVLFGVMVLVTAAVAIYTLIPERKFG